MKISSSGIHDGIIDDKYGVRGMNFIGDMPSYSLPLKFEDAPTETKTFAVVIVDHDAIPVSGFTWIHWAVANINSNELAENAALQQRYLNQGTNSWSSPLLAEPLSRMQAATYGGMVPPDKPHTYTIKVYALDSTLNINRGFYLNDLYAAMEGHILDKAILSAIYHN